MTQRQDWLQQRDMDCGGQKLDWSQLFSPKKAVVFSRGLVGRWGPRLKTAAAQTGETEKCCIDATALDLV